MDVIEQMFDACIGRRGFLGATAGAMAASTVGVSGCLDGDADGPVYRRWIPASFDPVAMYLDYEVLREEVWMEVPEDEEYGFTLYDVSEVIDLDRATVIAAAEDASPEIDGEEVGEHAGATMYERDSATASFVASDGDTVVEAQTRDAVESVVDARIGETPRLHEEDPVFDEVTMQAGDGDLVVVPGAEDRLEARAAYVSEDSNDVRIAVDTGEDDLAAVEDEYRAMDNLSIDETGQDAETDAAVLVLEGTVDDENLMEVFGLTASVSSQGDEAVESDEAESTGETSPGTGE